MVLPLLGAVAAIAPALKAASAIGGAFQAATQMKKTLEDLLKTPDAKYESSLSAADRRELDRLRFERRMRDFG